MFDSHCHLNFSAFDEDRDTVIEHAKRVGIRGLIIADYDSQRRGVSAELVQRSGIFATAGIHPWAVSENNEAWLQQQLTQLALDIETMPHKWCGIGELGLDYYRAGSTSERERQQKAFVAQLGLARDFNLPIVVHAVKCHNSLYDILRREGVPEAGGIMHGYSGSRAQVGNFLMLNLDISVGTPVTYPDPTKIRQVVQSVPLSRLLIESDAPDRPPYSKKGQRNEIHYLREVCDLVAEFYGEAPNTIASITEQNARNRFDLGEQVL